MVGSNQSGPVFYLVRDSARIFTLAVEHKGRLFCFVPNVHAFVYNKPLSVDYLIDRENQYDRINAQQAADIVHEGRIGWIDERTSGTLMEWATSGTDRIYPGVVFGH